MPTSTARLTAVLVLAVTASVAATTTSALAAPAAGGSGITLAPAHASTADTQTRSYFLRSVAGGHSYADAVRVTNGSAKTITLRVVPVDGVTAASTGADYGQPPATGDGRWILPATGIVTVPAHRTVEEGFRVQVPAGAYAGDHLAGLAFIDPTAQSSTRGSLTIKTVFRNVMGIETVVPGRAASRFVISAQSAAAGIGTGLATASLDIANVGRLLDKGRLSITLIAAKYRQTVTRQLGLILPGTSVHYLATWPTALPAGRYRMTSSLSGSDFPTVTRSTALTLATSLPGGPNAPIRPFAVAPGSATGSSTTVPAQGPVSSSQQPQQPPQVKALPHHRTHTAALVAGVVAGALLILLALAMAFFAGSRRRIATAPLSPAAAADRELVDA